MANILPKVSIVITNYNYERYISEAIESALNQDYDNVEVIVVDDGSTDNSRKIIESFEGKIISVFQSNQGHIAATNTGFEKSTGEVITFMDADDYLFTHMCKNVVKLFDEKVAKVHYKLMKVDSKGKHLGITPSEKVWLDEGSDVYKSLFKGNYNTSLGNAYNKNAISELFPLPQIKVFQEKNYLSTIPPDSYLNPRVPFYGEVKAIQESLAAYRQHGDNNGASVSPYTSFRKRRRYLVKAKTDTEFLLKKSTELGIKCDKEIRFNQYEILRLRLISLRIDNAHPFINDNRLYLLYLAVKNLKYPPKTSHLHNIFYILWMMMISILPANKLRKMFTSNKER